MKFFRRKKDRSLEVSVPCNICGSLKREINLDLGLSHCWACGAGGRLSQEEHEELTTFLGGYRSTLSIAPKRKNEEVLLTKDLPSIAIQEIKRRGFDVPWIVERYGVRWDGERLCWPAGAGWSRRSVVSWEEPKTITVAPRGLIGEHLIRPDGGPSGVPNSPLPKETDPDCKAPPRAPLHLVLTEGDWKSAAIPLPWIGLGLMGVEMSKEQEWTIRTCNPDSVLVLLDGGYETAMNNIVEQLLPIRARKARLPTGCGPDDIPRKDLVGLLIKESLK